MSIDRNPEQRERSRCDFQSLANWASELKTPIVCKLVTKRLLTAITIIEDAGTLCTSALMRTEAATTIPWQGIAESKSGTPIHLGF